MSGFEVAGVLLGSIPIVVSALEFYIKGIGTMGRWRRFTLELESLVLKLGTEEAKLQNVYEKLLRDIVPDDQIEPMLVDPFGPLWTEPGTVARIRRRLWRHMKLFEENVRSMNIAMEDMKQKLNIGPDGKVQWMEASGMKKQLKRVLFILQHDEYHSLLKRLREGVSNLEDLLSGNMELEPARCRGSQVKWYRLLRDLSSSIYEALRSTVTCACPGFHDVGLRVMSQPIIITPHDDEHEVVKSQKFHLVLSTASTTLASEADLWATTKIWNLLSLSLSAYTRGDTTTTTRPATVNVTSVSRPVVRFSLPTPEGSGMSQANESLSETLALDEITSSSILGRRNPQKISNLCQAMRRSRKQGVGECCGQIFDTSTTHSPGVFEVYPVGSPNDVSDWSPVSLGAILEGEAGSTLMYGDRLRLAWVVTSSVLQLDGTPWLSRVPSRDDIFLTKQDGAVYIRDVFIMKRFPQPALPDCTRVPAETYKANNTATLKALGTLLIELIFGQTIDRLRSTLGGTTTSIFAHHSAPGQPLSDYETAVRLLDHINTRVGSNYCSAVKWCINCEYPQGVVGFGGSPQNNVLVSVLNLLEQDLKTLTG